MTKAHEKLNYVFCRQGSRGHKTFFTAAFGWQFRRTGPDCCAFEGG